MGSRSGGAGRSGRQRIASAVQQVQSIIGVGPGAAMNDIDGTIALQMIMDNARPKGADAQYYARNAAYGVLYATSTGRTPAKINLTLRDMNALQATELVGRIVASGASTTADVVKWMRDNESEVLGLLPNNRWA